MVGLPALGIKAKDIAIYNPCSVYILKSYYCSYEFVSSAPFRYLIRLGLPLFLHPAPTMPIFLIYNCCSTGNNLVKQS